MKLDVENPEVFTERECVDCHDLEENIRRWIAKLGGDEATPYLSVELEKLINERLRT